MYYTTLINSFMVDVILGNPLKGCAGAGICKIFPTYSMLNVRSTCDGVEASVRMLPQNKVEITFDAKKLKARIKNTYFYNMIFKVETAYTIPVALSKQIGGEHEITIAPGEYPVEERGDFWVIQF